MSVNIICKRKQVLWVKMAKTNFHYQQNCELKLFNENEKVKRKQNFYCTFLCSKWPKKCKIIQRNMYKL